MINHRCSLDERQLELNAIAVNVAHDLMKFNGVCVKSISTIRPTPNSRVVNVVGSTVDYLYVTIELEAGDGGQLVLLTSCNVNVYDHSRDGANSAESCHTLTNVVRDVIHRHIVAVVGH